MDQNELTNQSLAELESLIVDNPKLERLESLLAQFNVFEAIGAVKHELRHSDFLAFLLDPSHFVLDHCSKSYVRFAVKVLDVPSLLSGEGWTPLGKDGAFRVC